MMEEVVGGSRDDWAGEGVGVWSNILKDRFMWFTHIWSPAAWESGASALRLF